MQDWNNLWLDLTNSVIHTVLYIHHVYPIGKYQHEFVSIVGLFRLDTFERCERYGVPVYYCQSALVRDYLEPLLLDIRNYFSKV